MAALIGAYWFFYSREADEGSSSSLVNNESVAPGNNIIDGVFQGIESGFFLVQPKNEEEPMQAIELTDNTSFVKMVLSQEMEIVKQEDIDLGDFIKGDNVSAHVFYDELIPGQKTALSIRLMVVE